MYGNIVRLRAMELMSHGASLPWQCTVPSEGTSFALSL